MNGKALTVLDPGLLVEIFLDMTAKITKKIRISYGQWLLKFPRSGSKTKYEKKN